MTQLLTGLAARDHLDHQRVGERIHAVALSVWAEYRQYDHSRARFDDSGLLGRRLVGTGCGPSTGTATTSPSATRPASASMATRRRLRLPACRVVWRVEAASQRPSSARNWGVSGALARRSSVVMGRHLRGGGGQVGQRIGGRQQLAEPPAGTGQAQPGRIGLMPSAEAASVGSAAHRRPAPEPCDPRRTWRAAPPGHGAPGVRRRSRPRRPRTPRR